jgi:pyruvate/2-oxoglutarate dehydrogenase complex dihydrolipoamide dehydrogenase (E3) component
LLNPRDHPRSSKLLGEVLRADGVDVRTGVRALRVHPRGSDGEYSVELSDGSRVAGSVVAVGIGRASPLADLGLRSIGIDHAGKPALPPDDRLRVADNVYVVGDPAGGPLSTHLAHYQGEMAVRIALGDDVKPDYSAIPQALYTEPEMAGVGLKVEEARGAGHDAFEETTDLGKAAKGYVTESVGHATIVVDRREKVLLGAFIAGPGASDAIHEAVLAIKTKTPIAVLADTIHAFPTTSRVLGTSFSQAAKKLA